MHQAAISLFTKQKAKLSLAANTVGALIAVGCTIYVVHSIASEKTLGTLLKPNATLLLAILVFITSLLAFAEGWRHLSSAYYDERLSFTANTLNVSKFHLYKYVPGNIWHYAVRQIDLKRLGVPMLKGVSISVWELSLITLSILLLSLAFWISLLFELSASVSFSLCLLLCLITTLCLRVIGKATPKLFLWYLGFVTIQLFGVWIIVISFGENSNPAALYPVFIRIHTGGSVG